ncbi:MAG: HAMP domain-containing histidine kinase [Rhizobiales bacterium]|nr:HAMP domain-containing histidine kinase [Hyphomicrobiales bacterium]
MIWRSLKFRLLAAAAICIIGALAAYWLVLSQVFERHVSERLYSELQAHLNQLATRLEVSGDVDIKVGDPLDNPRFTRPFGGLYWQVRTESGTVFGSRSLWDQTIELPAGDAAAGKVIRHRDINSNMGELMAIERSVLMGAEGKEQRVQLVVAMEQNELTNARSSFAADVSVLVALLALFLLAAAAMQVFIGLRPLNTLRQRLNSVAADETEGLEGRFPSEVEPLVDELNGLLKERAQMVERARASASDLAHGLKTPLAILSAEGRTLADGGNASASREIDLQVGVMNRHIERQLARARARGQSRLMSAGSELAPSFEKLIRAFRQLPRGDEIDWKMSIKYGLSADIDPMDLEETAGNILDNARKWTVDLVDVSARADGDQVLISITDNGPGVPDAQLQQILRRGKRLDEGAPGSGLGLAIIQDVVAIYDGTLIIENAEPQGLRVELRLPIAKPDRGSDTL